MIYCANSGDSRAILKSGNQTIPLSFDHKPTDSLEMARIKAAKHGVSSSRVDGQLALSRAFGDYQYKDQPNLPAEQQAVTAFPDVLSRPRDRDDSFMVVACDGIWDCVSNEECARRMTAKISKCHCDEKKELMSQPVEELFGEIMAPRLQN